MQANLHAPFNIPENALSLANELVDRVFDLIPATSPQLVISRLRQVIPNLSDSSCAHLLKQSCTNSAKIIIPNSLHPMSSTEQRRQAHEMLNGLRKLAEDLKCGTCYLGALSISELQQRMGDNYIGPEAYEKFFGWRINQPVPVPSGLSEALLDSRCTLNSFQQLKVCETHIVAYLPGTMFGRPFSINEFNSLFQGINRILKKAPHMTLASCGVREQFSSTSRLEDRWVCLPRHILPQTQGLSFDRQIAVLQSYPDYSQASIREAAIVYSMNYLWRKDPLLQTHGRCRERFHDGSMIYAGFIVPTHPSSSRQNSIPPQLLIDAAPESYERPYLGLAIARRLYLDQ